MYGTDIRTISGVYGFGISYPTFRMRFLTTLLVISVSLSVSLHLAIACRGGPIDQRLSTPIDPTNPHGYPTFKTNVDYQKYSETYMEYYRHNVEIDYTEFGYVLYHLPDGSEERIDGLACEPVMGYSEDPIYFVGYCIEGQEEYMCVDDIFSNDASSDDGAIDSLSIPVQDKYGIVYRNEKCALCNNVRDVEQWQLELVCSPGAINLTSHINMMQVLALMQSTKCVGSLLPPHGSTIVACDAQRVQTLKMLGLRPEVESVLEDLDLHDGGTELLPVTFSVLMNFGFNGMTHVLLRGVRRRDSHKTEPVPVNTDPVCPRGRVGGDCRPVHCGEGFQLRGSECIPMDSGSTTLGSSKYLPEDNTMELTQLVIQGNVSIGDYFAIVMSQGFKQGITATISDILNIDRIRIVNVTLELVDGNGSESPIKIYSMQLRNSTLDRVVDILKNSSFGHNTINVETIRTRIWPPPGVNYTTWNIQTLQQLNAQVNQDRSPTPSINMSATHQYIEDEHGFVNEAFRNCRVHGNQTDILMSINSTSDIYHNATYCSKVYVIANQVYQEVLESIANGKNCTSIPETVTIQISFIILPEVVGTSEAADRLIEVLNLLRDQIAQSVLILNVNDVQLQIMDVQETQPSSTEISSCSKGHIYQFPDGQYVVLPAYDNDSNDSRMSVYVNETNTIYREGEFDLTVLFEGDFLSLETTEVVFQYVFVCIMPYLADASCARIQLTDVEYEILENKTLVYKGDNLMMYEYQWNDNQLVEICVPPYRAKNDTLPNSRNVEYEYCTGEINKKLLIAEAYLTVLLVYVSLAAMSLVLFTYILFRKLRNLPGLNTVSLTLALLLAEIFFLCGSGDRDDRSCIAIAMALHYFFLCAFAWMNVMAYDLYYTFTNMHKLNHVLDTCRCFPRYSAFAWGAPAMLVTVCGLIDKLGEFEHFKIGYGFPTNEYHSQNDILSNASLSRDELLDADNATDVQERFNNVAIRKPMSCWIQEPKASLIVFGGPILVIMLANIYLFARTIATIQCASKQVVRQCSSSSVNRYTGKNDVIIYMRMSAVMGFTWIIGLASSIVSGAAGQDNISEVCLTVQIMAILFTLFNGSQGLFICCIFVLNRRVFNLYRTLIRTKTGQMKQMWGGRQNQRYRTRSTSQAP